MKTAVLSPLRRLRVVCREVTYTEQRSCHTMANSKPTAGIIIIGDEILKGHTSDTNSSFLCKELYSLGVKVEKISVIGDDLDTVAKEISSFSSTFTHVLTAGGIGPTHDDLTFEGVAKAFNEKLHLHPQLEEVCKQYFGEKISADSPHLKMAQIPESSHLMYGMNQKTGVKHPYPLVTVKNVFVFPGIPALMENAFHSLKDQLFASSGITFHTREVFLNEHELKVVDFLNQFVQKYKDTVQLGSYPEWNNSYYKLKLILESSSEENIEKAYSDLIDMLPKEYIVPYQKNPISSAADHVYALSKTSDSAGNFSHLIASAIKTVEEALDKYKLEEICAGFNGGKDCTALVHLYYAVVKRKYPDYKGQLQVLYVETPNTFPESEVFLSESVKRYNLKTITVKGRMKEALWELKKTHPEVKAVLMGTRSTDPYSASLREFSPTDSDWPEYMRVNPMLEWTYHNVWQFIRQLYVPYCRLYDKGYTSLGSRGFTEPNPSLRYLDEHGQVLYKPAYMLVNGTDERTGRKNSKIYRDPPTTD